MVALAVALGASAAFAEPKARPVNDTYWTWEACPADAGSGTKGNYRLKGDASNQKKGFAELAKELTAIDEDGLDEIGGFLHVIFTTNVTISNSDSEFWAALNGWIDCYDGGYGSLRIIADVDPQSGNRYNVTFDGDGTHQIFYWRGTSASYCHARFIGINFKGGLSEGGYGGAVYANCNASFRWCTFNNCHAYEGGAICAPGDINDDNLNGDFAKEVAYYGTFAIENCTFTDCEATDGGGAVWGNSGGDSGWTCIVQDCTFSNCKSKGSSGGGAVNSCYQKVLRSRFESCTAEGSGYGGALYACGEVACCLFDKCTSAANGGAVSCGLSTSTEVTLCTFINCTDKSGNAVYDVTGSGDITLNSCLFYGCNFRNGDNNISHEDIYNAVIDKQEYFASFKSGDYHFNVCDENGEGGYTDGPKPGNDAYKNYVDLDGRSYISGSYASGKYVIVGCFGYYTKDQWKDELFKKKQFEYDSGCDPLLVTTTGESANNKDGVVSFREALTYYGNASIRKKSSHPKEIKFQLPGSSPTITIKTNYVDVAKTGESLTIDGGNGITLAADGINGWTIGFYGDSNDKRIFKNMTLRVGIVSNSNSPKVGYEFINCAFEDAGNGSNIYKVGRVGSKWDSSGAEANWKFERCTFADYTDSVYIVDPGCSGTIVTFDACTFTRISMPASIARGVGKSITYRNCTLFDNGAPTMRSDFGGAPWDNHTPATESFYNCIICQSLYNLSGNPAPKLYNTAVSDTPGEVFNSAMPVEKTINGVVQIGFEPKHKGTARGVEPSSPYWSQIPTYDIFGNTNPSTRYASQGSWFVNDKEDPSLLVNDPGDYSDEYDDKITLREALTYAADPANKHIIVGATVRPIFDEAAFPDGNVVVKLNGTISFFEDTYANYPCELQPGEGQTLTITSPNSSALTLYGGMKMRVKDTTFKSCGNNTNGGAVWSYGQLLLDGCRFDGCQAYGSWGGALWFGGDSQTFIHDTTFTGCKAWIGGAIVNYGDLVAIGVTLTGNEANLASAVLDGDAKRTLFANATIVNNTAKESGGGAFCADGTSAGLINSIVAGNKNGNLAGSWSVAPTSYDKFATGNWCAYSLTSGELADIFLTANAIPTNMPNGVTQLYYPLSSKSAAKNGAFVFTKGGLNDKGEVVAGSWPEKVGYSTDIDGYSPLPRELNGAAMGDKYGANFNGYASRDLTGALIMPKDTGMGAVPSFSADVIDASSLVDTLEDVVSDTDGKVSLREAVDYAMAHGGQVNFAPSIFAGADPVFRLENQIVVPEGCSFELKAPGDHRITLVATATGGNRFFRVEDGGTLKLEGVTMGYGTARGIYGLMSPADDSNGGAVCGVASVKANGEKKMSDLSFVNCAFFDNKAPKGYGGAIYAEGLLSLTDCVFIGNSAGKEGGAVYSKEATMTMTGCEVTNNIAEVNGGGVGIYPGGVTNVIKNSKISGNVAGKRGGGLFCDDGKPTGCVTLTDADIKGNTADTGLYADPDVFSGTGYAFDEQYILRVNRKYYEVLTDEFGVKRVELSEKAAPVLGSIDLGAAATSGKATVKVSNVIPNLEYGLGHAETPVGPYVVDKWQRATSEADLELEAPAEGAGGFYRVMAREVE